MTLTAQGHKRLVAASVVEGPVIGFRMSSSSKNSRPSGETWCGPWSATDDQNQSKEHFTFSLSRFEPDWELFGLDARNPNFERSVCPFARCFCDLLMGLKLRNDFHHRFLRLEHPELTDMMIWI